MLRELSRSIDTLLVYQLQLCDGSVYPTKKVDNRHNGVGTAGILKLYQSTFSSRDCTFLNYLLNRRTTRPYLVCSSWFQTHTLMLCSPFKTMAPYFINCISAGIRSGTNISLLGKGNYSGKIHSGVRPKGPGVCSAPRGLTGKKVHLCFSL